MSQRGAYEADRAAGDRPDTLVVTTPAMCFETYRAEVIPRHLPRLAVEAFGLKFPNAVGLAAGFDKNGHAWPAAAALGFGHVEIGTCLLYTSDAADE